MSPMAARGGSTPGHSRGSPFSIVEGWGGDEDSDVDIESDSKDSDSGAVGREEELRPASTTGSTSLRRESAAPSSEVARPGRPFKGHQTGDVADILRSRGSKEKSLTSRSRSGSMEGGAKRLDARRYRRELSAKMSGSKIPVRSKPPVQAGQMSESAKAAGKERGNFPREKGNFKKSSPPPLKRTSVKDGAERSETEKTDTRDEKGRRSENLQSPELSDSRKTCEQSVRDTGKKQAFQELEGTHKVAERKFGLRDGAGLSKDSEDGLKKRGREDLTESPPKSKRLRRDEESRAPTPVPEKRIMPKRRLDKDAEVSPSKLPAPDKQRLCNLPTPKSIPLQKFAPPKRGEDVETYLSAEESREAAGRDLAMDDSDQGPQEEKKQFRKPPNGGAKSVLSRLGSKDVDGEGADDQLELEKLYKVFERRPTRISEGGTEGKEILSDSRSRGTTKEQEEKKRQQSAGGSDEHRKSAKQPCESGEDIAHRRTARSLEKEKAGRVGGGSVRGHKDVSEIGNAPFSEKLKKSLASPGVDGQQQPSESKEGNTHRSPSRGLEKEKASPVGGGLVRGQKDVSEIGKGPFPEKLKKTLASPGVDRQQQPSDSEEGNTHRRPSRSLEKERASPVGGGLVRGHKDVSATGKGPVSEKLKKTLASLGVDRQQQLSESEEGIALQRPTRKLEKEKASPVGGGLVRGQKDVSETGKTPFSEKLKKTPASPGVDRQQAYGLAGGNEPKRVAFGVSKLVNKGKLIAKRKDVQVQRSMDSSGKMEHGIKIVPGARLEAKYGPGEEAIISEDQPNPGTQRVSNGKGKDVRRWKETNTGSSSLMRTENIETIAVIELGDHLGSIISVSSSDEDVDTPIAPVDAISEGSLPQKMQEENEGVLEEGEIEIESPEGNEAHAECVGTKEAERHSSSDWTVLREGACASDQIVAGSIENRLRSDPHAGKIGEAGSEGPEFVPDAGGEKLTEILACTRSGYHEMSPAMVIDLGDSCGDRGRYGDQKENQHHTIIEYCRPEASGRTGQGIITSHEKSAARSPVLGERIVQTSEALSVHNLNGEDSSDSEDANASDHHNSYCEICGLGGELLCCDGSGCRITYHLGCTDPKLVAVPSGNWYCPTCAQKRLSFGVHALSKSVESIWDVRDHFPSSEKEYFVKWKGMSHAHNTWVAENELMKMSLKKLSKYKKKLKEGQASIWNPEWTEPQRIISKASSKAPVRHGLDSGVKWFVKWKGLGYDGCTWEPYDSTVFGTAKAKELGTVFDRFCEAAKQRNSCHQVAEANKLRDASFKQLESQPDWMQIRQLLAYQLDRLNQLRQRWQKNLNAIIVDEDDQEKMSAVVAFLLSLTKEYMVYNPILLVVPGFEIQSWEEEVSDYAPDVYTVVYTGSREAKSVIQQHELEIGNKVAETSKVQLVLTTYEAASSDFDQLSCLTWAAVILDDSQQFKITKSHRSSLEFDTAFRLLFVNELSKYNVEELQQMLLFLQPQNPASADMHRRLAEIDESGQLLYLKDQLSEQIVRNSKPDDASGLELRECWVGAHMTPIQAHLYINILTKHYTLLHSGRLRKDQDSPSLNELMTQLRYCCQHPYVADPTLQESIMEAVKSSRTVLDVGIEASGKLQLLHVMLSVIHAQGHRVLILSQIAMQLFILEDYIFQTFGQDSWEIVDTRHSASKKNIAIQKFNAKDSTRFIFLLKTGASSVSLKLRDTDIVIIHDSDLNPANDLEYLRKVLQKVDGEVKVFRLFLRSTVEEGSMVSTRKRTLDPDTKPLTAVVLQKLLRWKVKHVLELDTPSPIEALAQKGKRSFDPLKDELEPDLARVRDLLQRTVSGMEELGDEIVEGVGAEEDGGSAKEYWSVLLKDKYVALQEREELNTTKGLRQRKKVMYCEEALALAPYSAVEEEEGRRKRKRPQFLGLDPEIPQEKSRHSSLQSSPSTPGHAKDRLVRNELSSRTMPEVQPVKLPEPVLVITGQGSDQDAQHVVREEEELGPVVGDQVRGHVHEAFEGERLLSPDPVTSGAKIARSEDLVEQAPSNTHTTTSPTGSVPATPSDVDDGRRMRMEQTHQQLTMEPELSKICGMFQAMFQAPEKIATYSQQLLAYVMSNFRMPSSPTKLVIMIELSLFLVAAAHLDQAVEHVPAVSRVAEEMNLQLKDGEFRPVYEKVEVMCKNYVALSSPRKRVREAETAPTEAAQVETLCGPTLACNEVSVPEIPSPQLPKQFSTGNDNLQIQAGQQASSQQGPLGQNCAGPGSSPRATHGQDSQLRRSKSAEHQQKQPRPSEIEHSLPVIETSQTRDTDVVSGITHPQLESVPASSETQSAPSEIEKQMLLKLKLDRDQLLQRCMALQKWEVHAFHVHRKAREDDLARLFEDNKAAITSCDASQRGEMLRYLEDTFAANDVLAKQEASEDLARMNNKQRDDRDKVNALYAKFIKLEELRERVSSSGKPPDMFLEAQTMGIKFAMPLPALEVLEHGQAHGEQARQPLPPQDQQSTALHSPPITIRALSQPQSRPQSPLQPPSQRLPHPQVQAQPTPQPPLQSQAQRQPPSPVASVPQHGAQPQPQPQPPARPHSPSQLQSQRSHLAQVESTSYPLRQPGLPRLSRATVLEARARAGLRPFPQQGDHGSLPETHPDLLQQSQRPPLPQPHPQPQPQPQVQSFEPPQAAQQRTHSQFSGPRIPMEWIPDVHAQVSVPQELASVRSQPSHPTLPQRSQSQQNTQLQERLQPSPYTHQQMLASSRNMSGSEPLPVNSPYLLGRMRPVGDQRMTQHSIIQQPRVSQTIHPLASMQPRVLQSAQPNLQPRVSQMVQPSGAMEPRVAPSIPSSTNQQARVLLTSQVGVQPRVQRSLVPLTSSLQAPWPVSLYGQALDPPAQAHGQPQPEQQQTGGQGFFMPSTGLTGGAIPLASQIRPSTSVYSTSPSMVQGLSMQSQLGPDPLLHEENRVKKEHEQLRRIYEVERTEIKAQYDRDAEALRKKYESLLLGKYQEMEQKSYVLNGILDKLDRNRRLAEALKSRSFLDLPKVRAVPGQTGESITASGQVHHSSGGITSRSGRGHVQPSHQTSVWAARNVGANTGVVGSLGSSAVVSNVSGRTITGPVLGVGFAPPTIAGGHNSTSRAGLWPSSSPNGRLAWLGAQNQNVPPNDLTSRGHAFSSPSQSLPLPTQLPDESTRSPTFTVSTVVPVSSGSLQSDTLFQGSFENLIRPQQSNPLCSQDIGQSTQQRRSWTPLSGGPSGSVVPLTSPPVEQSFLHHSRTESAPLLSTAAPVRSISPTGCSPIVTEATSVSVGPIFPSPQVVWMGPESAALDFNHMRPRTPFSDSFSLLEEGGGELLPSLAVNQIPSAIDSRIRDEALEAEAVLDPAPSHGQSGFVSQPSTIGLDSSTPTSQVDFILLSDDED